MKIINEHYLVEARNFIAVNQEVYDFYEEIGDERAGVVIPVGASNVYLIEMFEDETREELTGT